MLIFLTALKILVIRDIKHYAKITPFGRDFSYARQSGFATLRPDNKFVNHKFYIKQKQETNSNKFDCSPAFALYIFAIAKIIIWTSLCEIALAYR